jgi:hypothetical protein
LSCLQLVDRLDQGAFSSGAPGQLTYQGLYKLVSKALYRAHVEGKLKREIIQVGGGCCGWTRVLQMGWTAVVKTVVGFEAGSNAAAIQCPI